MRGPNSANSTGIAFARSTAPRAEPRTEPRFELDVIAALYGFDPFSEITDGMTEKRLDKTLRHRDLRGVPEFRGVFLASSELLTKVSVPRSRVVPPERSYSGVNAHVVYGDGPCAVGVLPDGACRFVVRPAGRDACACAG